MFNFGYLSSGHYTYVGKYVRIRGYFSKAKGARERKRLGNTDLDDPEFEHRQGHENFLFCKSLISALEPTSLLFN